MKQAIVVLILLFIAGGFAAVMQGLGIFAQVFYNIFPIFAPVFEKAITDYLSSAYFIVGVIIFLFSTGGIILTIKEKKFFYAIVSAILNFISLVSIVSNLARCSY